MPTAFNIVKDAASIIAFLDDKKEEVVMVVHKRCFLVSRLFPRSVVFNLMLERDPPFGHPVL